MSTLPPFVVLAIMPQLDAPSLSSFIRCSKEHYGAWSSSPWVQALWLWTSIIASSSSSSSEPAHLILHVEEEEQDFKPLPFRNDAMSDGHRLLDENDTKRLQQAMEARLLTGGPLCRALRSNNLLVLQQVLQRISSCCRTWTASPIPPAGASAAGSAPLLNAAAAALVQRELRSALHIAVLVSSVPCLQHLLQHYYAGNPNVRMLGLTPAHCAALLNRPEHLRVLLQSPNVDARMLSLHPHVVGTVLHIAVYHSLPCIPVCLEAPGVDVNQTHRAAGGRTALHHAAWLAQPDALQMLLAAPGINVNARDTGRAYFGGVLCMRTPLHLAAHWGCPACVAALLEAEGIDVNLVDGDGTTALFLAARSKFPARAGRERSKGLADYAECVRLLLAAPGANIHFKIGDAPIASPVAARYLHGLTALAAARQSNRAAAHLLARAGVRGPGCSEFTLWVAFAAVGVVGAGVVAWLAWEFLVGPQRRVDPDSPLWQAFLSFVGLSLPVVTVTTLGMHSLWFTIFEHT